MPAERTAGSPGFRSSLLLLLVVVFINIAGFSLILPLLPFYGNALNASPVEITTLFAVYSLGNIFGEIYWGRMSDRVGRKRVLTVAVGCAALSYVAFAFAPNLILALLVRTTTGFFSGTLGVCQSYIADITEPEHRARNIGYFGAAFNSGFALGPAIGGLLARPELGLPGFRLPILTAAALAGAASLWAAFMLKESRPKGEARPLPNWSRALHFVGTHGLILRMFVIAFIGIAAFSSMEAVFGLWTEHNFGWSAHEVGLTFIAVGGAGAFVQIFLIGPLTRRFGEARVIVGGLTVLALSMLLQPVLRNPIAAVVLMSTLMAGHSLAFPNAGALVSRSTDPHEQGSVNGLLMACNALARIIAPPVYGFVYSALGPDAPYYLCTLMIGGAAIVGLQAVRVRDAELRIQEEKIA